MRLLFIVLADYILCRYTGPLTVHVQEPDTFGRHVVQIEGKEEVQSIELPLQTKPYKRLKRKKTRIQNGDEVSRLLMSFSSYCAPPQIDLDTSTAVDAAGNESQLLWFTLDNEMALIRRVDLHADEYSWQLALKYERHVGVQVRWNFFD